MLTQFNVTSKCLLITLSMILLSSCGGGSGGTSPLNEANINLIFVVSPDLAYQASGDVDPGTANLTPQGLQRSLLMGTYLKEDVLGGKNVSTIAALEPMTHLQTADNYPDMAGLGYIQEFALLNQVTLLKTTAYSYPIATCYGEGSVPDGVVKPVSYKGECQGLDFNDAAGNNIALATRFIDGKRPGFHVFAAPWETISPLLADINRIRGYGLPVPTSYAGPNVVYAISLTPDGNASLVTYDSNLEPMPTYPEIPSSMGRAACDQQEPFSIERKGGVDGATVPANMNTNETVYLIRHAEAHPLEGWDDGNYIGAGQWRSLALPDALRGKISPDQVYSIDPSQAFDIGDFELFSYIRPSLTVWPYVIANNLPYNLAASFYLGSADDPDVARTTKDFFFTHGKFSNQTVLVAWEHEHFPPLITALLESYGGSARIPSLSWPSGDYDTLWTVKLDAQGNLTVDNALCEGIKSDVLPDEPPQF